MDIVTRSARAIGAVMGARRAARWVRAHRMARGHRMDWALSRLGLERATSSWPAVGLATLSALVGVGVALALAPSSGAELRTRLHDRLDEAKRKRFPHTTSAQVS